MFISKCFFSIVILCVVYQTYSKPTESPLTTGRGIGSTLWGWISYPFTGWWGSSESDPTPINDQLVASTTYGPNDSIEFGKHNVTVWCNEQTCTTMKCNKDGCRNNTCNIYDTHLDGECREYNTVVDPEKTITPLELTTISNPQSNEHINETTKSPEIAPVSVTAATAENVDKDQTKRDIENVETTVRPADKIPDVPAFTGLSIKERKTATKPEDTNGTVGQ